MTTTLIPNYISAGEFVKFIDSLDSRIPDPLTVKALQEVGISESNSYTLKGSLVGMGIYDEEGKLLQRNDLIGLSSRDEDARRETFKRILKRTYAELMKAIPVEKATVAKIETYFRVNGAAATPAIKGARLFIWLARQAGYKTADTDFIPSSIEQEKNQKAKVDTSKKKPKNHAVRVNTVHETDIALPITPRLGIDYDETYLNLLLKKIDESDGLPSEAVMKEVNRLIEKIDEKNKSGHARNSPEPSLPREENGDA
jgi:hypothetical protein